MRHGLVRGRRWIHESAIYRPGGATIHTMLLPLDRERAQLLLDLQIPISAMAWHHHHPIVPPCCHASHVLHACLCTQCHHAPLPPHTPPYACMPPYAIILACI